MKYIATFILSLSFSMLYSESFDFLEAEVLSLKNSNPERILFVGNSYLYYNDSLHNHLRRMAEEMNPKREDFFESYEDLDEELEELEDISVEGYPSLTYWLGQQLMMTRCSNEGAVVKWTLVPFIVEEDTREEDNDFDPFYQDPSQNV